MERYVLRARAVDQPGIIHKLTGGIASTGGNILDSAQHCDEDSGQLSVRVEFESGADSEDIRTELVDRLAQFDPIIELRKVKDKRRALIMVSKLDHCLDDLLYRYRRGELPIEIALVVSNHEDLRNVVEAAGLPFHHIPVTAETKPAAEQKLATLVNESRTDFIVLARYMQILSDDFSAKFAGRIINIHHSFLPSFKGAKPYHQARQRGVKLIGATAHYVTADLDEGPIIEQDVVRVNHRSSADNLVVIGRDVERKVLSEAVRLHADDRVFLSGNHTVILG
ncbi:formyltetrahydrofolate deformylase [Paenarthrobacter aromaticivorans]|uniref:Formyltetrahydrofolate deformylase n=1 Tax=Paenarthrobacter aromaticivorans TaxID=2849150 RepID=A0ABS6I7V0_9MICC|nr:formyltetrahydrofolate deformylase [Paenarthrobacter sp. MMS21-TAE1-1]MBU8867800.1 formyltetrahydrofolate deformylase [Paenarthrobacter sp. MMS21-TAE1-1]